MSPAGGEKAGPRVAADRAERSAAARPRNPPRAAHMAAMPAVPEMDAARPAMALAVPSSQPYLVATRRCRGGPRHRPAPHGPAGGVGTAVAAAHEALGEMAAPTVAAGSGGRKSWPPATPPHRPSAAPPPAHTARLKSQLARARKIPGVAGYGVLVEEANDIALK